MSIHIILSPSVIIGLAIAATIVGNISSQLSLHEANAQGATSLIAGDLTAVSNATSFGGEKIGSYAVTPSGQKVEIHLHVEKTPTAGNVLEAWLVDAKTNSSLSLGQVETDIEPPSLSFIQTMVNPYVYSKIMITEEPQNDANPAPSQPIGGADLETPFGA
jgi:hypothetical protein